jgi:hypothetical protein
LGNVRAMADAILDTIDYPIRRESLVERARYFSVERAADESERAIYP